MLLKLGQDSKQSGRGGVTPPLPINHYTMKTKIYKVSRERAIQIAANHNCVSKEIASKYTDGELKEVLRQLKLKADF